MIRRRFPFVNTRDVRNRHKLDVIPARPVYPRSIGRQDPALGTVQLQLRAMRHTAGRVFNEPDPSIGRNVEQVSPIYTTRNDSNNPEIRSQFKFVPIPVKLSPVSHWALIPIMCFKVGHQRVPQSQSRTHAKPPGAQLLYTFNNFDRSTDERVHTE